MVSTCTTEPSRAPRSSGSTLSSWAPGCSRRSYTVDKLNYFTARVSGVSDPGAPARQHAYLSALGTLTEVQVHFGSFLAKAAWRPLTNLPVAGRRMDTPTAVTLPADNHAVVGSQTLPVGSYPTSSRGRKRRRKAVAPLTDAVIAEVHTMEEKGSDVNLAVHLLNDAWRGLFDAAVVISNDTDLVTPIRMVTMERKKNRYSSSVRGTGRQLRSWPTLQVMCDTFGARW